MNQKKEKRFFNRLSLLKIGIFSHLFPTCYSFSSDVKFYRFPFHYIWEFFTLWWCVWNSLLSIFYNWRELKKKKQSHLGIVVAVSNLVTISLFTFTLFLKPRIIGNKPLWWWIYTSVWHYVAPAISLIFFFTEAELKESILQKKNKKKKIFSLIILQPTFFTLSNFVRKWTLSSWGNKKFLGENEVGKKLKFKKFIVLWFDHADQFINNIKRGKEIKEIINNIFLIIVYIGLTFFSFYSLSYLLIEIKSRFFCQKRKLISK